MPVCTIHLLSLAVPISQFLKSLQESDAKPLTTARVVRWIVKPTRFSKDALLNTPQQWEILLILPEATASLPPALNKLVKHSWSIQAGIPSKLVSSLEATNRNLLYPKPEDVLPLTGALSRPRIADSSQGLELSNELRRWIEDGQRPKGPVSMLNLLAFQPGKKEEYLKYGKAFAESIGSSRGGVAKIVGKIVPQSCSDGSDEWEEVYYVFLAL